MQKYYNNVISASGKPVQGASVLVTVLSTGAVATIYSDNGVTTTTNPLTTDAYGQFSFYADVNRYSFSVTANGAVGYSFSDVILEDYYDSFTYTDTGILGGWSSTTAGYNQLLVQNKSNTATASANYILANSATTAVAGYGEFGMNSPSFTGTGSFSLPNVTYVNSVTTDLVLGSSGGASVRLVSGTVASDAATVTTSNIFTAAPIAVPAGGSTSARLGLSSAATLGIYFGSGVPTVSAAQGSLYIRTDGSSTSTRMYINTNGATTWTNVTTAA